MSLFVIRLLLALIVFILALLLCAETLCEVSSLSFRRGWCLLFLRVRVLLLVLLLLLRLHGLLAADVIEYTLQILI